MAFLTCSLCDYNTSRAWNLRRHLMRHHKAEDDSTLIGNSVVKASNERANSPIYGEHMRPLAELHTIDVNATERRGELSGKISIAEMNREPTTSHARSVLLPTLPAPLDSVTLAPRHTASVASASTNRNSHPSKMHSERQPPNLVERRGERCENQGVGADKHHVNRMGTYYTSTSPTAYSSADISPALGSPLFSPDATYFSVKRPSLSSESQHIYRLEQQCARAKKDIAELELMVASLNQTLTAHDAMLASLLRGAHQEHHE